MIKRDTFQRTLELSPEGFDSFSADAFQHLEGTCYYHQHHFYSKSFLCKSVDCHAKSGLSPTQPYRPGACVCSVFSSSLQPHGLAQLICQALLSMQFSRQEYWSRFPFPTPGDLPEPGIEPASPALAVRFFATEPPGKSTNQPGDTTTKILGKDCLGPSELRPVKLSWPSSKTQTCHCELFLCHFQRHLNDKPQPHPTYHQN